MKFKILALLLALMLLLSACGRSEVQTEDQGTSENTSMKGNEDSQSSGSETSQPTQMQSSQGSSGEDGREPLELPENDTLAALTIYGLSLEYPDFEIESVYTAAQSEDGIYAVFASGGIDYIAHVYAIADERTGSGTRDLYAPEVGYAAFDLIDALPDGLTEMETERYVAALERISMPTVYSH